MPLFFISFMPEIAMMEEKEPLSFGKGSAVCVYITLWVTNAFIFYYVSACVSMFQDR